MLFGAVPAFAADADISETSATVQADEEVLHQQEVLKALDLISADSYGELDNSKEVTRVEFASTVGKILEINPTVSADTSYYADVTTDHWATYTLNNLVERGVLSVPEDKKFRPNDVISYSEAVKIFVSLLGYDDYAKANGGYPGGYISAANRIKLLNGVSANENVTTGMLTTLMYNAIHTKVLEVEKMGDSVKYSNDNERTLLSLYKSIYFTEGIVEAVNGLTLTGNKIGENKCLIDGKIYQNGKINVTDMLGYFVTAYYEDNGSGVKTLVHLDDTDNKVLTVRAEDFKSYEGNKVYYYNENYKEKNVKTDGSLTVVKNGSVVTKGLSEAFKVTEGEIRLIDNDDDNSYDIIFIEDYRVVVVKSLNKTDGVITDDLDVKNIIDYSKIDSDSIWVYGSNGVLMGIDAITAGSVIDVALSENGMVVHVSSNVFEGTVEAVSDREKKVTIDGVEYEYVDKAIKKYSVSVGKHGSFKTNKYGKIAYFSETTSALKGGFLVDVSNDQNGVSSALKVKILTTEGEVKIYNVSDKVIIDRERVKKNVFKNLSEVKNTVVMYSVNSKEEVSEFDTINLNTSAGEDESTLQRVAILDDSAQDQRYYKEDSKFGRKYYISSDAVFFRVPTSGNGADDEYGLVDKSGLGSNKGYAAVIYKTGTSLESNFVTMKQTKYDINDWSPYYWIKEVRKGISKNGDEVFKLIAYTEKGLETTLDLSVNYPAEGIPDTGDIIRIGKDAQGVGGYIETHYDYTTRKAGYFDVDDEWGHRDMDKYWYNFSDLYNYDRLCFSSAVTINGNIIGVTREARGAETTDEYFKVSSKTAVVVYDAVEDTFRSGTIGDIMPADVYGDMCSELIVHTRYGAPISIFVINNRAN